MDLRLDNRVADMDASSLVKREEASLNRVDFLIYVFDYMEAIISNHDLLLGPNLFISFHRTLIKFHNLSELILVSLLVGASNYASFEEVCDMEIRKAWTLNGLRHHSRLHLTWTLKYLQYALIRTCKRILASIFVNGLKNTVWIRVDCPQRFRVEWRLLHM